MNKPLKILIVEDMNSARKLFSKYFARKGFITVTAPDGIEAIEKFSHHTFEIVLTNYLMPKMNGLDLVDWIKNNIYPKPLIVFYTVYMSECLSLNVIESGADEFIHTDLINEDYPDIVLDLYLDKLIKEMI